MSGSGADAAKEEEDVSQLQFGGLADAEWIPNSHVSMLLAQIAANKYGGGEAGAGASSSGGRPPPEVFAKAREYASRFVGAVEITDSAAIDELFSSLRGLAWAREGTAEGEPAPAATLHQYQVRVRA